MPTAQAGKSTDSDLLPQLIKQYPGIDFDKFIALNDASFSSYELADEFGVSQNVAWRIKSRLNNVNSIVQDFKDKKLSYLLSQQYQAIALQAKIIEYYLIHRHFKALNAKEKILLLQATNNIAGTLEDKQQVIINVKGNAQFNTVQISPEETRQIQASMGKTILNNILSSGDKEDKSEDKQADNESL